MLRQYRRTQISATSQESIDFDVVIQQAKLFADFIEENKVQIINVLLKYESYHVALDEIEKSKGCLLSIAELRRYFSHQVESVSSFFPLNLPLYSLVLFAIVPSWSSSNVYIRPPLKMKAMFSELVNVLRLSHFFPKIHVSDCDRKKFLSDFASKSDVIIFTGTYENAMEVKKSCRKNSLFIFNGAGHNPVVIGKDCDIDLAVKKTIEVKTFNNGQDCAGPDAIFVDESISGIFIERLLVTLGEIRVGDYGDHQNIIGKVTDDESLPAIAKFLSRFKDKIIYGGEIDFKNSIVKPTVILTKITENVNFDEIFSPVFFVTTYKEDTDLELYFARPEYAKHEMYVSLFGSSGTVELLVNSTILRNKIIHEVERGNDEFGGAGKGASFVSIDGEYICQPILIPREIDNYLSRKLHHTIAQMKQCPIEANAIESEFKKATGLFGDNLVFGFVFGSFAKGRSKPESDIDMFICLKSRSPQDEEKFIAWYIELHKKYGRQPDYEYPVEIMTHAELLNMEQALPTLTLNLKSVSSLIFDYTTWAQILEDKKFAMTGDAREVNRLAAQCRPYPALWKNQFIDLMREQYAATGSIENRDYYNSGQTPAVYLARIQQQDFIYFSKRVIPFERLATNQLALSRAIASSEESSLSFREKHTYVFTKEFRPENLRNISGVIEVRIKRAFVNDFLFRMNELGRAYGGVNKNEYTQKEWDFFADECEFYEYIKDDEPVGFALIYRGAVTGFGSSDFTCERNREEITILFEGLSASFSDLRLAKQFFEKLITSVFVGSKYNESIRVNAIVLNNDLRLQRFCEMGFVPHPEVQVQTSSIKMSI